jgi:hypothetical protein
MGGFGGQRTFKLGRKALGSSHGALDARSWNLVLTWGRSRSVARLGESETRRSPSVLKLETCPCRNETRKGRAVGE